MHFLGFAGMPRRIPEYPDVYEYLNYISTLGSMITGISTLFFIYHFYQSFSGSYHFKIK
jgi:cytochrome c oxidase subunit 1